MNKKELWLKLKNYHFDHLIPANLWDKVTEIFAGTDSSTKAFASKIARKLEWKNNFALKAITEYKKFVYLATVSDFQVTPSKIIDQVWHEHLLFTKAYRDFCIEVINYNFDHHPELIPITDQTGVFNAQYLDTLELYRIEFGIEPPDQIWSVPKFNPEIVDANKYESKKKKVSNTTGNGSDYYDDTPLVTSFSQELGSDQSDNFAEFGGGDFGGGGADGTWTDSASGDSDSSDGNSGSDGGSGCSSGCGGGD